MKKILIGVAAVVALAVAAFVVPGFAVGGAAVLLQADSPLEAAQKKCVETSHLSYAKVGDGGKTLTIQTDGKESGGISVNTLNCLLTELKVSDAIRNEISTTRALDGKQSGEWGSYRATWSYHPDNGMRMTVTKK